MIIIITVRTYRKPPQKAPTNVLVRNVSLDTVSVTWRYIAPTSEEEPIQGYKVSLLINQFRNKQTNNIFVFM